MIFILLTLDKSELTLFVPFYGFGHITVILLSVGKTCHEKHSKHSNKNSGTTHKLFSMIQSSRIKNWCRSQ